MMPKESKSNPFFKVRGIQTIIRMVRNNRTGDSLVSFDNRKDDVLTLWLFKRETKLRRRRICLVGKREFFLQSLLSPTGIDFEKIIKSLTMYFESREVYCCPMCSYATSGAHCTCPKDFKRPSHHWTLRMREKIC